MTLERLGGLLVQFSGAAVQYGAGTDSWLTSAWSTYRHSSH